MTSSSSRRVALVHEWLESSAGSEKTFERMADSLPEAELFALTCSEKYSDWGPEMSRSGRPIQTTLLQKVGPLREKRSISLPLMPFAWQLLGRTSFDVVVTSSHAFSRYFPLGKASHLSYVHSPIRFAWVPSIDGRGDGHVAAPARWMLRKADKRTVARVDSFSANSSTVRDRIREFYGRDANVIYPPVDVGRFAPARASRAPGDYLLAFSRWVPYKRLELAIRIGEELDMPIVIAGSGPEEANLRRLAASSRACVRFEVRPSDERVTQLLASAAALIFPANEDFGIVPVEAQAAGTPVVCLASGGASETVLDGVTGAHSPTEFLEDFVAATRQALSLRTPLSTFGEHVAQFAAERFDEDFSSWLSPYL